MICLRCGVRLANDAAFCWKCGVATGVTKPWADKSSDTGTVLLGKESYGWKSGPEPTSKHEPQHIYRCPNCESILRRPREAFTETLCCPTCGTVTKYVGIYNWDIMSPEEQDRITGKADADDTFKKPVSPSNKKVYCCSFCGKVKLRPGDEEDKTIICDDCGRTMTLIGCYEWSSMAAEDKHKAIAAKLNEGATTTTAEDSASSYFGDPAGIGLSSAASADSDPAARSFFWITFMKVLTWILLGVCVIGGGVLFDNFDMAFLGVLVGGLVGMVMMAGVMIMLGMAEDLRYIRNNMHRK